MRRLFPCGSTGTKDKIDEEQKTHRKSIEISGVERKNFHRDQKHLTLPIAIGTGGPWFDVGPQKRSFTASLFYSINLTSAFLEKNKQYGIILIINNSVM